MKAKDPIRVLVVEDHVVVREGLVTMIEQQPDMTVVGEAGNGREAVERFRELLPTVTLLDLRLPRLDGFETMRALRAEDGKARVLVLTSYEGDEDVYRALEAGALGYLMKDATRDEMLAAIRAVAAGQRCVPPAVASRLVGQLPRVELTPREVEVLRLMARGDTNKEIGVALRITEATVKVHVSAILGRLGARDRTEAVLVAMRRGLLHVL